MKSPEQYRINKAVPYGTPYLIKHPRTRSKLLVIASTEMEGWNHVSVSLVTRTPIWDEMCYVKKIFFEEEELCLQFHPKKSQYVNAHPNCLHIWNPPKEIVKILENGFIQ